MKRKKMMISGVIILLIISVIILTNSLIITQRTYNRALDNHQSERDDLKRDNGDLRDILEMLETEVSEKNDLINTLNGESEDVRLLMKASDLTNAELEKQLKHYNIYLSAQVELIKTLNDAHQLLELVILDIETYEVYNYYYLPPSATLEESAIEIADHLSSMIFEGLRIEIMGEAYIDDKRILQINLGEINKKNEDGIYVSPSWSNHYFQGSTGGYYTYTTLTGSFMQNDYAGEWYDGIYFTYEGETVGFEHVEGLIGKVIYE